MTGDQSGRNNTPDPSFWLSLQCLSPWPSQPDLPPSRPCRALARLPPGAQADRLSGAACAWWTFAGFDHASNSATAAAGRFGVGLCNCVAAPNSPDPWDSQAKEQQMNFASQ